MLSDRREQQLREYSIALQEYHDAQRVILDAIHNDSVSFEHFEQKALAHYGSGLALKGKKLELAQLRAQTCPSHRPQLPGSSAGEDIVV